MHSSQEEIEDQCATHGMPYVALDTKTNELVCNMCVYQLDSADNLDFTSYIAGSLKGVFDDKFNEYKEHMEKMSDIAPKAISLHLERTVSEFFGKIAEQMKAVEFQVMEKVRASKNL